MKLIVVGKFYTEGFALHIAETLVDMGHVVLRYEPGMQRSKNNSKIWHRINQVRQVIYDASDALPKIRAKRIASLIQQTQKHTPDIILVCHDFLLPCEVAQLKEAAPLTKIALWFPDTLANFGKAYFMNAPYDGLFFKDPFIIKALFGVLASPVYYLPECFNPKKHYLPAGEVISDEYICDITTAGSSHSWRIAYYQHLLNYEVKLWGPPPPLWMPPQIVTQIHQHKLVHNQEKAQAFLGAKIVLNNLLYGEIWGLNVRTFEAAGIGAFQMVDWRLGLNQLFKDGEEIISYTSLVDMHHKIDYWLAHPKERMAIATAGKQRAYQEHTYQHRLQLIFNTLFGNATGFPLPQDGNNHG